MHRRNLTKRQELPRSTAAMEMFRRTMFSRRDRSRARGYARILRLLWRHARAIGELCQPGRMRERSSLVCRMRYDESRCESCGETSARCQQDFVRCGGLGSRSVGHGVSRDGAARASRRLAAPVDENHGPRARRAAVHRSVVDTPCNPGPWGVLSIARGERIADERIAIFDNAAARD